ncbi:MAG TPA: MmcQ/YjbR family DNA-binding protein [Vicinamibacterales bacterium]|nr:MmcQ/YjbR family DNA-binding protein [Vicinamibacterales bacterium]
MSCDYKIVCRLALALPGVEESTSYGTPALKVKGQLMTRLWEDGKTLVMKTTFEQRDELLAAEPDTYYLTDHYAGYPWVLIRLPHVHPDAMSDLLHAAHALASSEKRPPRRKAARRRQ